MNLFEMSKPIQTTAEKIKQRRLQILVHSYIYYELDKNIIEDYKWDKWAKELVDLQRTYPEIASKVIYADEFKDWAGSTGAFLKFDDWVKNKANYLLKLKNGVKNEN